MTKKQNKTMCFLTFLRIEKIQDILNENDEVQRHFQAGLNQILDLVDTNASDDTIFIQIVNLQSHIDNFLN